MSGRWRSCSCSGAVAPRAPGALIAVGRRACWLSRALGLETDGVDVLGTFDASLPDLGVPGVASDDLERLVAGALGIALLAYAESIAAARQFATAHGYEVDANRELIAVGASNIGVGLAQGFPVDASMSRTVGRRRRRAAHAARRADQRRARRRGDRPPRRVLRRPPEGHARRDRDRGGASR